MRILLVLFTLCVLTLSPCVAQDEWRSAYKVGDAIELKITDALWQKGVVTEITPGGMMRVNCEDFVQGTYRRVGGVYIVYGKGDIRQAGRAPAVDPAANGTQPPAQQPGQPNAAQPGQGHACLSNQPSGTVTRNAAASTGLFQRLIYENYRDKEIGRKTGVTFLTFAIAETYVNRLSDGVPRHMTAAVGTTIYRVKTDHHFCVQYTDSILRTDVKEGYFLIFKDKAGDWVAAPDGKRSWEQSHLKN